MSNGDLYWIANYNWGIFDDVLRGKYRDVILPMAVLRRLDAVLEGSKQAVLDMKAALDDVGVVGAGRRPAPSRGSGVLQHLPLYPQRPARPRQPSTADGALAARHPHAEGAGP